MITLRTEQILVSESYTNVFIVDPPDTIDDYILISDSGGFGVGSEDAGWTRPSIQIIVADKDKATLDARIYAIRTLLHDITDTEIIAVNYTLAEWQDITTWDSWTYWDAYVDTDGNLINQNIDTYEKVKGYDISSDIINLGRDEQRRYMSSINFTVYSNI